MVRGILSAVSQSSAETVVESVTEDIAKQISMLGKLKDALLDYLPTILGALLTLVIGIVVVKLLEKLFKRWVFKSRVEPTAQAFLHSIVHVGLWSLVVVSVLSALKVPTTSIIAIIGAAGLAISLALQNTLSNMAGGFILLFTKPFKVGDFISIDAISGKVERITIMTTRLLTIDNKSIYIPNGQMSNARITNFTEEPVRRLDLNFPISYESDFLEAIKVITQVITDNPLAKTDPEPVVRLGEYGDSALVIAVKIWVDSDKYWDLHFDMMEQVKLAFDRNNISIPYNHLEVRVQKHTE